jgi:hypothetical protein
VSLNENRQFSTRQDQSWATTRQERMHGLMWLTPLYYPVIDTKWDLNLPRRHIPRHCVCLRHAIPRTKSLPDGQLGKRIDMKPTNRPTTPDGQQQTYRPTTPGVPAQNMQHTQTGCHQHERTKQHFNSSASHPTRGTGIP